MVASSENVGVAMGLVIGAGAATCLGAAVVFFPTLVRFASRKTLAGALGLSAGVMMYVSFAEILVKSQLSFQDAEFSLDQAKLYATLCFFAGVVFMVGLNQLVTYVLGGHHHHHHNHNHNNNQNSPNHHHHHPQHVLADSTTVHANTTNSVQEDVAVVQEPNNKNKIQKTENYYDDDNNNDDNESATNRSGGDAHCNQYELTAPCPCHDDNPTQTLERLQHMAQSMAQHPNRPHHHHHNHHHHNHDNADQEDEGKQEIRHHHHQDKDDSKVDVSSAATEEPLPADEPLSTPGSSVRDDDEPAVAPTKRVIVMDLEAGDNNNKDDHDNDGEEVDVDNADNEDDEDDPDIHDESSSANATNKSQRKLMAMSLNTALAIGLHNFPEGLATFVAALNDPKVGAVLAVAIAIHNIPEGLCVAMPVYYATGNKWKAFGWATLSGVAEPVAGLFGWIILAQSFSYQLYAVLFGMVAGMMVIISVRELLPTAHRYDPEDSVVTYSFIAGMGIMALSLMLFLI
ncbi:hypothetical protein ACA910_006586 [Epithemia clementina (nom. ined.)]